MQYTQSLMDGIIEKANRALVQNERDFIQDGLIHCGVCGGKKQTRLFGTMIVRCKLSSLSCTGVGAGSQVYGLEFVGAFGFW